MMEDLNCTFVLPLKEMALRRVVINFWSDSHVLALIANHRGISISNSFEYRFHFKKTIEPVVREKISKLALPKSLKMPIFRLVRPIGMQILDWKNFHVNYVHQSNGDIGVPALTKLCWTTRGAIDYRKTAEELILCEMLDDEKRFLLASLYCLERFVTLRWDKFRDEMLRRMYREGVSYICCRCPICCCLEGEESELDNMHCDASQAPIKFDIRAFEYFSRIGNKAAVEYFFQRLTDEDLNRSLTRIVSSFFKDDTIGISIYRNQLDSIFNDFPMSKKNDVLVYLLSLMSPAMQMEMLKQSPVDILMSFMEYPWQDLFLEIADRVWEFLSPSCYSSLWKRIWDEVQKHYFPEIFQKFFMNSPIGFREFFVSARSVSVYFLELFFRFEDSDTIGVIVRHIDPEHRRTLIEEYLYHLCNNSILESSKMELHLVEVCLREAKLSKKDAEFLKTSFSERVNAMNRQRPTEWIRRNFSRFFQILDEIYPSSPQKRSSEDEGLSNNKKLILQE